MVQNTNNILFIIDNVREYYEKQANLDFYRKKCGCAALFAVAIAPLNNKKAERYFTFSNFKFYFD